MKMSSVKWRLFCFDFDMVKRTVCLANNEWQNAAPKIEKIFSGLAYKLLLSFTVISDDNRCFVPMNIVFTKYYIAQRISKLCWGFEIHRLRQ